MRTLDGREELMALLIGLGLMGTGGGGDPQGWGCSVFEADLKAGRKYVLVDPSEVHDEAFVVSGGYLGSVEEDTELERTVEGWESSFELEEAIRILEDEHRRKADFLVPFELGGGNTPVVMSCAARMGIPVVDGDGVGRASPETHMCSFLCYEVPLMPMPLVGADGTRVLVRAGDIFLADEIGRAVASRKRGLVANAHYGMSGRQLKDSVVPNSISKALELGKYVMGLRLKGLDALEAIADFLQGYPLFWGEVANVEGRSSGGFYLSCVRLGGLDKYSGQHLELVIKNEVMCAKLDGRPVAIFPDLVLLLDPHTFHGVMTPKLTVGREVMVIGTPCHPRIREAVNTSIGRKVFSPARYGESLEYRPIEELMS